MSAYNDRIHHTITSGGRSIKIASDHGPDVSIYRLSNEVDRGYKHFLRKRGLMDEEWQTKMEIQAAKARKAKAARRACK